LAAGVILERCPASPPHPTGSVSMSKSEAARLAARRHWVAEQEREAARFEEETPSSTLGDGALGKADIGGLADVALSMPLSRAESWRSCRT
jgi:hypothetical protein